MGNASSLRRRRQDQQPPITSSQATRNSGTTTIAMSTAPAPWRALLEKSIAKNRAIPSARYIQIATVRPDGRPSNRTVVFRGFLGASGAAGAAAAAAASADALTIVTDARSRKVGECAANPRTEVCWYLPQTREQYRVSGTLEIIGEAEEGEEEEEEAGAAAAGGRRSGLPSSRLALLRAVREYAWQRMSDAGREQFFWPHPGQPRLDGDEAAFLGAGAGGGDSRRGNKGQDAAPQPPPPPPPPPPPVPATFCLGLIEPDEVDHVRLKTNRRTHYVLKAGGEWSVEEVNP
jgi:pyridoxamine 5'-phosphate oxidase